LYRRNQPNMKVNEQLIYIASNSKGDRLFDAMRTRYNRSIYIEAGYRSIKRIDVLMKLLSVFKFSLRDVNKDPEIDLWFRTKLERETIRKVKNNADPGTIRENDIVLWFPLFPIASEWKKYGRLSAITDVAMDEAYFEHFNIPQGRPRAIRKNNWDITFENCDHIFTLSKWALGVNKKLYPEKAEKLTSIGWGPNILPPPVDEIFHSVQTSKVLCIGHDYYRKGVDVFNEVARKLKRRVRDVECVIVGRPGRKIDLSKLDALRIYPSAEPQQVSSLMKGSAIFVMFSRYEPAGHVTVEAMSHGLPVICSNVCGMPEPVVHGKTGYVIDTGNMEDIVEKISSLLTNHEKFDSFRRAAYEHAMQNWQWKHVADHVMNAYLAS